MNKKSSKISKASGMARHILRRSIADAKIAAIHTGIEQLDDQIGEVQELLQKMQQGREKMVDKLAAIEDRVDELDPPNATENLQKMKAPEIVDRCMTLLISPRESARRQVGIILAALQFSVFNEVKLIVWKEARRKQPGGKDDAVALRDRYGRLLGLVLDESPKRPGALPPRRGRRPDANIEERSRIAHQAPAQPRG